MIQGFPKKKDLPKIEDIKDEETKCISFRDLGYNQAIEECESACLKIMCDKCKEKLNEKQ